MPEYEKLPVPRFEYMGREFEGPGTIAEDTRTWKITFPEESGIEPAYAYEIDPSSMPPACASYRATTREIDFPKKGEKAAALLHEIGHAETVPTEYYEPTGLERTYMEFLAGYRALMRARSEETERWLRHGLLVAYSKGLKKGLSKEEVSNAREEAMIDSGYMDYRTRKTRE